MAEGRADHVTVDGGNGDGDGEERYVLNADLEALQAAEPSEAVRLLPPFDPWILGPGTADPQLVGPARRALFSQGANPVIVGGTVAGTWRLRPDGRGVLLPRSRRPSCGKSRRRTSAVGSDPCGRCEHQLLDDLET